MRLQRRLLILGLTAAFAVQGFAGPKRIVKKNTIVSSALPRIRVEVKGDFKYAGRFEFRIRDVAKGERFVFVDATQDKKVRRLFIAQFEGFLPHVDDYFRYSFKNALVFGAFRFRYNPYAYSNLEARKRNPKGEGVLMEDFLKSKGFSLEDGLMMSRFITVAGDDKKHELILYYLENISKTRLALGEFYKDDKPTSKWIEIARELKERSLSSFAIK